jgi:hypothetical protein
MINSTAETPTYLGMLSNVNMTGPGLVGEPGIKRGLWGGEEGSWAFFFSVNRRIEALCERSEVGRVGSE